MKCLAQLFRLANSEIIISVDIFTIDIQPLKQTLSIMWKTFNKNTHRLDYMTYT